MKFKLYTVVGGLIVLLSSCNEKTEDNSLGIETVENYAEIVLANYEDTYEDAIEMQQAIEYFLMQPTENGLNQAREAWLSARETYGQTDAFRFYGGPIDDEDGPEGQINAWPLDEAYIDYVENGSETTNANIINSPEDFPEITASIIASLNENGSETNVSSGYHAIEFLLWGQDLSDGPGGGERPYTDYSTEGTTTAKNQTRRRTYLMEVSKLLIADLGSLVQEWDSGKNNFRQHFIATPSKSIEKVISGLGKLSKGELAGERMFVPFDLQSKEDEHSCFSDNTHRDIVNNAVGIQNVFMGTYKRTDGTVISGASIYDLLASKDEALATELKSLITQSVAACKAIQPPFDQEFKSVEGRARISKAISLLRKQGDKLAEAAQVFDVNPENK